MVAMGLARLSWFEIRVDDPISLFDGYPHRSPDANHSDFTALNALSAPLSTHSKRVAKLFIGEKSAFALFPFILGATETLAITAVVFH
jgi:hypothetical protein